MFALNALFGALALGLLPGAPAQSTHPVVGVQSGRGPQPDEVPVRPEINAFAAAGGPQWDLYIQALQALQQVNASDPLSYFQICGIHGEPYIPWDNDPSTGAGSDWLGYCDHGEYRFITFHRPYLALYEQALNAQAQEIASMYPQSMIATYQDAASTLRIPYWDWAANSALPPVVTQETISIQTYQNGATQQITNPLYSYSYPEAVKSGQYGPDLEGKTATTRCAPGSAAAAASSRMQAANLGGSVYNVFTRSTDFESMASVQGSGTSFEDPHNTVHTLATCGNDFSDLRFAGFDPLFMLHHCNVDRLYAMWQAIYPGSATASFSGISAEGDFGTPAGTTVTQDYPLKPFVQSGGAYHTSTTITNTWDLGYTYAGITPWTTPANQITQNMIQTVNSLYGQTAASSRHRRRDGTTQYFAQLAIDKSKITEYPCVLNLLLAGQPVGSMGLVAVPSTGIANTEMPLYGAMSKGMMGTPALDKTGADWFSSNIKITFNRPDGTLIDSVDRSSVNITIVAADVQSPAQANEFPHYKHLGAFANL